MRPLLGALPAVMLLSLTIMACGDSTVSSSPSSSVASRGLSESGSSGAVAGSYWHYDSDKDPDDQPHGGDGGENDNLKLLAEYGQKANRTETQAIAATVKHYYAAALADDGAGVCALLDTSLAAGLAQGGRGSGEAAETSCAAYITHLFGQQHALFVADDVPTMVVIEVRTKENVALAVVGFRAKPESEILLERASGSWKLAALFDSPLP
jgi:hypothetical protein